MAGPLGSPLPISAPSLDRCRELGPGPLLGSGNVERWRVRLGGLSLVLRWSPCTYRFCVLGKKPSFHVPRFPLL